MSEIGRRITAPDRPALIITGRQGGRWIVEPVEEFAAPRLLSDEEAAVHGVAGVPHDDVRAQEAEGWSNLGSSHVFDVTGARPVRPW